MDSRQSLPIMVYEFQANIGCCDGCRKDVEKRLGRLQGIKSVSLHPEICKIIVTGTARASTILREIHKKKSGAQLLSAVPAKQSAILFELADDIQAHDEHKEHQRMRNFDEKMATAVVVPFNGDATSQHNAIKENSRKTDRIQAEKIRFAVNVSVCGFGAGIEYERGLIYK